MDLWISISAYFSFTNFFFGAVIFYLTFQSNNKNIPYRYFNLSIAGYSFFYTLCMLIKDPYFITLLGRITLSFVIFVAYYYAQASMAVCNYKSLNSLRITNFIITLFLAILSATSSLIISDATNTLGSHPWLNTGPLFEVYLAFFSVNMVLGIYTLAKNVRQTPIAKELLIGSTLGFLGGCANFLIFYGIPFPPVLNGLVTVYGIIMAKVMLKSEFFKLKIAISKFASTSIAILVIIFLFLFSNLFLKLTFPPMIYIILLSSIIALLFHRIKLLIQTPLEKRLLRGEYSIDESLKNIAASLVSSTGRKNVFDTISDQLKEILEVKTVHILFPEEIEKMSKENYLLLDPANRLLGNFSAQSSLINFFISQKEIIKTPNISVNLLASLSILNLSNDSLFVPVHSSGELQGVFILDNKLSEDPYTQKDEAFLASIASQLIVVFDKIEYKEKLQRTNRALQRTNNDLQNEILKTAKATETAQNLANQASLSQLSHGISHEIRNPLNVIRMGSQQIEKFIDLLIKTKKTEASTHVSDDELYNLATDVSKLKKDLTKYGYIDEKNTIKNIPSLHNSRRFKLSDNFSAIKEEVRYFLLTKLGFEKAKRDIQSIVAQSDRIVRIADEMLKYGNASRGITKHFFTTITSEQESEAIWNELKELSIIDSYGLISASHERLNSITLSPSFKKLQEAVIHKLKISKDAYKTKICLTSVLEKSKLLFETKVLESDISVTYMMAAKQTVLGNEDDLIRVVINLVNNAVDAISNTKKTSKELLLSTSDKPFKDLNGQLKQGVCLSIKDTGEGIAPENIPKIKTAFFTTKSPTGGIHSGLGLSYVYRIIESYGGYIDVKSEVEKGTTFYIYLVAAECSDT